MNCFRDRWSINKVRQSVPFLPSVIDGSRQFTMPIGPDLFRVACGMGLEGLVRRVKVKMKNPASPAMTRAKDVDWSSGSRR
jgi:hypothetical protein